MASRKCDCTTKRAGSRKATTKPEASTDNARKSSRTTSKRTSRTTNCN